MKIAMCQINSVIGDFHNNVKKIIKYINKSKTSNCDLVIFPELAVSGYPPLDLIENKDFINQNQSALNKIVEHTDNISLILGSLNNKNGKLFNSAFYISNKKISFIQDKTLLPNYDVFDEKRYFSSAYKHKNFKIKNKNVALLICEDIWFNVYKDKYEFDPVKRVLNDKTELLIVIAASPFSKNKFENRADICNKLSLKYNIPVIYLNSIGGQDEIIFDGASFIVFKNKINVCKQFNEDYKITNLNELNLLKNNYIKKNEIEIIYNAIILGLKDYFKKSNIKKAVIGISGGIDSAVVAPLAVAAFGSENVIGVIMPSIFTSKTSIDDATQLVKNLGIKYHIVSITNLFEQYKKDLQLIFEGYGEDVTEENIQSRIRGNILMAIANKFGGMVLTTGNKSELSMGYTTLYGDLIGGIAAIGDLLKRDVYKLGRYINIDNIVIPESIFNKAPSAELRFHQKDEDSLPPYNILDEVLYLHIEKGYTKQEIISKGYNKKIIDEIFKKLYGQEFKRKQAPLVIKLTEKNFGIGRRIPVTNKFYK